MLRFLEKVFQDIREGENIDDNESTERLSDP